MKIELFHLISHPESAEVRRFLTASNLLPHVSFRNIAYDTHADALKALTGTLDVPFVVLNESEHLSGKTAILTRLAQLKP